MSIVVQCHDVPSRAICSPCAPHLRAGRPLTIRGAENPPCRAGAMTRGSPSVAST